MTDQNKSPIECVGVVCFRENEVLLIRRGQAPRAGQWSIPGGRIQPDENEKTAALRELTEETSVQAELIEKIETVITEIDEKTYHLHDYVARWIRAKPMAGDDAVEACFVSLDDIETFGMWTETERIIRKAYEMLYSEQSN